MKESTRRFFLDILKHNIAIIIYNIVVSIMATAIAILMRYHNLYLWFTPFIIGILLIIFTPFISVILSNKIKMEIVDEKKPNKKAINNLMLAK